MALPSRLSAATACSRSRTRQPTSLALLFLWVKKAGVTIVHTTADELLIEDGVLTGVRAGHKTYKADRVIVATGGASYPQTGSTGDGYRFAKQAGHTVVPANPSLVPVGRGRRHLSKANGSQSAQRAADRV